MPEAHRQIDLFDEQDQQRHQKLIQAIDEINAQWGWERSSLPRRGCTPPGG